MTKAFDAETEIKAVFDKHGIKNTTEAFVWYTEYIATGTNKSEIFSILEKHGW